MGYRSILAWCQQKITQLLSTPAISPVSIVFASMRGGVITIPSVPAFTLLDPTLTHTLASNGLYYCYLQGSARNPVGANSINIRIERVGTGIVSQQQTIFNQIDMTPFHISWTMNHLAGQQIAAFYSSPLQNVDLLDVELGIIKLA